MIEQIKKAVMAGLMIALGGWIFLAVGGGVTGSLLFSLGLICVCVFGFNLYTGKICYVLENKNVAALLVMLVLNLGTAILIGQLSRIVKPDVISFAEKASQAKLEKGYFAVFLAGVVCDMLICIAVEGWKRQPNMAGIVIIFLSVAGFILTGSEHCIADAFYLSASNQLFSGAGLIFMLLCIAGNTVGGILCRLLVKDKI